MTRNVRRFGSNQSLGHDQTGFVADQPGDPVQVIGAKRDTTFGGIARPAPAVQEDGRAPSFFGTRPVPIGEKHEIIKSVTPSKPFVAVRIGSADHEVVILLGRVVGPKIAGADGHRPIGRARHPVGPQKPEPIVKTVTKTVTKKRKMTTLSEAQKVQLEKEMAAFVVPPSDIAVPPMPGEDDKYGEEKGTGIGGDATAAQEIEAKLSTLSQLIAQLNQQLLPEVKRSRSKLQAEVHAFNGESRGSEKRKAATMSEGSLGRRRQQYGEALTHLRKLLTIGAGGEDSASSTFQDMDDSQLKEMFGSVLGELEALVVAAEKTDGGAENSVRSVAGSANVVVDESAITIDLGDAIGSVLPNKDNKKLADAPVKVCDPAFLSRKVPTGCRVDGTSNGAVGGNDCGASPSTATDSSSSAVIPPENIARESDLISSVSLIEEVLRDRTGRFSGIDVESTDDQLASVGPLTDAAAQMRLKKAANAQAIHHLGEMQKAEAKASELEGKMDKLQQEKATSGGDDDNVCATEKDVEYLMDEGLDALHRRKDLLEELISALRLLYDERGVDFDSSSIDWSAAAASTLAQNAPKSTPHPDWTRAADSSYAHRGSVRTLIDTPTFHDTISKLDVVADAMGGYNEGIDRLIDFIAGDERDGGSVSKTVKTAILNVAGRIPIPPQYYKWREKAGILAA